MKGTRNKVCRRAWAGAGRQLAAVLNSESSAAIASQPAPADWRTRRLACPCGWEGDSRAMAMELHDQVTDYACPQCGNLLMIVLVLGLSVIAFFSADLAGGTHPDVVQPHRR